MASSLLLSTKSLPSGESERASKAKGKRQHVISHDESGDGVRPRLGICRSGIGYLRPTLLPLAAFKLAGGEEETAAALAAPEEEGTGRRQDTTCAAICCAPVLAAGVWVVVCEEEEEYARKKKNRVPGP